MAGELSNESAGDAEISAATGEETVALVPGEESRPGASGSTSGDERPRQLGRYLIIGFIGAGGMGVVYRAYDPRLQREVALKCVRTGILSREAQQRMVLEAQSMAKLSHPNVVAVYDVDTLDERVVLAMELVEGPTLRDWIKADSHPWREVIELCVAAGQGLAAAHATGIVHRDFKPDNVLIGTDGRPRVTDFGLARVQTVADPSQPSYDGSEVTSGRSLDLTAAGQVMGTPAYMAPEQHAAQPLSPTADQYAFCVSVWYALTGRRPFSGSTLLELAEAKNEGAPPFPRVTPAVPTPIIEAVRRGLSTRPEDRWPSMELLLEALQFDPDAVRRRWTWRAAVASIVVLGGVALGGWVKSAQNVCADLAEERIDEVWSDDARAGVSDALLAMDTSYAAGVAERVREALDAYVDAWTSARVDACEASNLRGEQSAAAMDLRMACLDRARLELEATVEVLSHPDRTSLERADNLVAALPSIERCSDVEALTASVPPPADPEIGAQVDELRRRLARARALHQAGKFGEADEVARSLGVAAEEIEYPPLVTEVELVQGRAARALADFPRAEQLLRSALRRALHWGQWPEALEASQRLALMLSTSLARYVEGESLLDVARGLDQRSEFGPRERAETIGIIAAVEEAQGDPAASREHYEEAIALQLEVLDESHVDVLEMRSHLASTSGALGEFARAEKEHRAVLEARRARLGATHPDVAESLNYVAVTVQEQGRYDEAEKLLKEALQLRVDGMGPDHPSVANTRINMGNLLLARGDMDGAEKEFRTALAIYEHHFGEHGTQAALAHTNLGNALYQAGRYAESEQEHRAALECDLAVLPPTHPDVAATKHNIGLVLYTEDRPREAVEMYLEAEPIWIQTLGPDHPILGFVHSNLALAYLSLGELKDAEREILESLEIRKAKLGPAHTLTLVSRANYGLILKAEGDFEGALEQIDQVVEGQTEALGPKHPDTGTAYANRGDILLTLERYDDARESYMHAKEILEASLGEKAARTSQPYEGLGKVALAQGKRAEARRWFDKEWAVMEPQTTHIIARARSAYYLAQVLWPDQRERAIALAQEAVKGLEVLNTEDLPEVEQWLADRTGG